MNNQYIETQIKSFINKRKTIERIINDKQQCIIDYILRTANRTQSMFVYKGLPKTIPQRILETYLQLNGSCIISEVSGELYAFTGGLGGPPDVYYEPTIYTVANPALNYSANLKIDDECVLLRNDSMYEGLLPIFLKYAYLLTENDISLNIAQINARLVSLITASDDRTKTAADIYINKVKDGELSVIGENGFLDGVKVQPYGGANNGITSLIELHQYYYASLYNELGLQSNYNMKRERIGGDEAALNEDVLYPLIDDMLRNRKEGVERVNAKYNLEIEVELNSSWALENAYKEKEMNEEEFFKDSYEDDRVSDDNLDNDRAESVLIASGEIAEIRIEGEDLHVETEETSTSNNEINVGGGLLDDDGW